MSPITSDAVIQVAQDGSGKRVRNIAVQAFIDAGDGQGAVLQTIYMQATAVTLVDDQGDPVSLDDTIHDPAWKRDLLDEMRAIRVGLELLLDGGQAKPAATALDGSLLDVARERRELAEQET